MLGISNSKTPSVGNVTGFSTGTTVLLVHAADGAGVWAAAVLVDSSATAGVAHGTLLFASGADDVALCWDVLVESEGAR